MRRSNPVSDQGQPETIRCLLCRGVVCYSDMADQRYRDHLTLEHRVHYYIPWIIKKTLQENGLLPGKSSHNNSSNSNNSAAAAAGVKEETDFHGDNDSSVEDEESMSVSYDEDSANFVQVIPQIEGDYDDDNNGVGGEGLDGVGENFDGHDFGYDERFDSSLNEASLEEHIVEGRGGRGKKVYSCSLCPHLKHFPSLHKAERHRNTHIPVAFRKLFQCPQCKERFINDKNLRRHLDTDSCQGIKIHSCPVCAEKFDNKFDLLDHQENHDEFRRRFKCRMCSAKFSKAKYLKRHIQTHSAEKPFKCDLCEKAFKSDHYMKVHRRSHGYADEYNAIGYVNCGTNGDEGTDDADGVFIYDCDVSVEEQEDDDTNNTELERAGDDVDTPQIT